MNILKKIYLKIKYRNHPAKFMIDAPWEWKIGLDENSYISWESGDLYEDEDGNVHDFNHTGKMKKI